jgi:hypothetical protein
MSFYHLGDATYQNTQFNPAFMPEGRVFVGLPILSGVHVHANNKFSYNDAITKENGDNVVSFSRIISELQNQNLSSAHANVSLFHVGYRFRNGLAVSLFANERMEGDLLYPKSLVEFIWDGVGSSLGDDVDVGSTAANISHFREIGLGAAYRVNEQLRVGARIKYLQGLFNYSIPTNMQATLRVNPQTYTWNLSAENMVFQTAGLAILEGDEGDIGSHLVSPGNTGVGLDLGFEYRANNVLSFAASLTDLGFISWKTDVENRQYNDTTFVYDGVDTDNTNDYVEALQDSLFDQFSTTINNNAYTTLLPMRAYGSMIYKYNESTELIGSIGARYIQGQMKMLYGGGVRKTWGSVVASANVVKLPQQFFNLGLGLAVKGGPVQYYMAADQVINFSVTDARAFDFRMGVNFIFGDSGGRSGRRGSGYANGGYGGDPRSRSRSGKGISTGSFLGERVKTRRRSGIYSIIPKQQRRKVPKSKKPPKGKQ